MRSILIVAFVAVAAPVGAQAPPPALQLVEDLRIGSIDGPEALSKVSSITVSPDGTMLYVAQPLEHAIRWYEASSGKLLGRIGRHGEGPGEFRHLSTIGWRADTLYATDFLLQRFSLFSRTGAHLRTQTVNSPCKVSTAESNVTLPAEIMSHLAGDEPSYV